MDSQILHISTIQPEQLLRNPEYMENCKNCIWAETMNDSYLFCEYHALSVHAGSGPCKHFQTVDNPPESEDEE